MTACVLRLTAMLFGARYGPRYLGGGLSRCITRWYRSLMRRMVALFLVFSLTLVTVIVPSSRIAQAFSGPQGSGTYLSQQGIASESGDRSARAAKPCSRGMTVLSCAFLPPASPQTSAARRMLSTAASFPDGIHPSGREVAPPSRPPKHISA
jgi:hypothetical protein